MYNFKYSYRTKDSAILPLLLVAVSLIYSFIFSLAVAKVAMVNGATTEAEISAFASLPWVTVINMLLGQVFIIGTYIIYSLVAGKDMAVASTVKGKFQWLPFLVVIAMSVVCLFGFNYLVAVIDTGISNITGKGVSAVEVVGGFGGLVLSSFCFAIVPAIVEEFVYRGVVFNGLKTSFKPVTAILLSALIFMLMHFNIYQTFYQFILGVVLSLICYYTGSILYSIVFHMLNNFMVVLFAYVAPNLFVVSNMSAPIMLLIVGGALLAAGALFGLFVLLKKLCQKYDTRAKVIEEKSEQEQTIENTEGLSEYDIKQLNIKPQGYSKKLLWYVIAILVVMWIITNFV